MANTKITFGNFTLEDDGTNVHFYNEGLELLVFSRTTGQFELLTSAEGTFGGINLNNNEVTVGPTTYITFDPVTDDISINGDVVIENLKANPRLSSGDFAGEATLDLSGSAAVSNTVIEAGSVVILNPSEALSGKVYEDKASRSAGTSFTIVSDAGAGDGGRKVQWVIFNIV
jgi:hypothetical protein